MKRKQPIKKHTNSLLLKDLYAIVQELLLKGETPPFNKSCLWVIGLSKHHQLLVIELLNTKSLEELQANEVFQVPLQKHASFILLCERPHQQDWQLGEERLIIIQQLQQVGYLIDLPILDYLLIKEQECISLSQTGQLQHPPTERTPLTVEEAEILAQEAVEQAQKALEDTYYQDKEEIALHLYQEGLAIAQIVAITGLSEEILVVLLDIAK